MKTADKKPPVPKGRQGGATCTWPSRTLCPADTHEHRDRRSYPTLSPRSQGCTSGVNLNVLGMYQQKG